MSHRSPKSCLPAMPALAAATMFSRPGDPHTDSRKDDAKAAVRKNRIRLLMPSCIGAEVDEAISPLATD